MVFDYGDGELHSLKPQRHYWGRLLGALLSTTVPRSVSILSYAVTCPASQPSVSVQLISSRTAGGGGAPVGLPLKKILKS